MKRYSRYTLHMAYPQGAMIIAYTLLNQAPVGPAVHLHRFYGPVIGGVGQGTEGDRPFAILLSSHPQHTLGVGPPVSSEKFRRLRKLNLRLIRTSPTPTN